MKKSNKKKANIAKVQEKVNNIMNRTADVVETTTETVMEATQEVISEMKEVAQNTVEATKEAATELKANTEEVTAELKEKVAPVVEEVKKTVRTPRKKAAPVVVPEVYVQWNESESCVATLIEKAKEAYSAEHSDAIVSCRLYIKPEDNTAYYVINEVAGQIAL